MIKRKPKKCNECGRDDQPLFSKGRCRGCASKSYGKPKVKKKKTGELEMFLEIWMERPHICEVTGEPIPFFSVSSFAHILSKGAFPSLRLRKDNIALVLPEIHHEYDCGDRSHPKFDKINEKADQLKREYYVTTD